MSAVRIPLTGSGGFTLVDAEDAALVAQFAWHRTSQGYALRQQPTRLSLHRFLMEPPADLVVDHKNGNRLDNRRANLEVVTASENARRGAAKRRYARYLQELECTRQGQAILKFPIQRGDNVRRGAKDYRCWQRMQAERRQEEARND
jgi:hypothetical protein